MVRNIWVAEIGVQHISVGACVVAFWFHCPLSFLVNNFVYLLSLVLELGGRLLACTPVSFQR